MAGALYNVKRKYQNKCQLGVTGITGDLDRELEIYKKKPSGALQLVSKEGVIYSRCLSRALWVMMMRYVTGFARWSA